MRTILTFALIIGFLLFGYILLGIFWVIGKFAPKAADLCQLRIVQFILKGVGFLAGAKVTWIGEENIPKDEAVLYVANHICRTFCRRPETRWSLFPKSYSGDASCTH